MKFNLLTSVSDVLPNGKCLWLCECGNTKEIRISSVKSGNTKSCGCLQKTLRTKPKYKTHGMCKTPTYKSWRSMLYRCKSASKIYYKGKGISVCERWSNSFENFLADMGERPLNHTLDRINPDGSYEPSNCRWATSKTQCRNRTNNKIITFNNNSATIAEWEIITKIPYATIHARLTRGWSAEKALTTPIDTSKHTFANLKKSA
jgi:hypothetical protein